MNTSIHKSIITALMFLALLMVPASYAVAGEAKAALAFDGQTFQDIDLDNAIAAMKRGKNGSRIILKPSRPVRLQVKLMRLPEKRKISYLYTALAVAGIDPVPEVSHRMFIASKGGKIISVYVEDNAAANITRTLKVDQEIDLRAYHIYTYAKGPAYLVVGFDKESEK